MTELGTRLKEARLSKGYSLDDLQEMTKIQKRYLVAIEEGNYSIMPGSFYIRAFIKQYAEAVDLDSEELLEEYKQDIPNHQKEEVVQSISKSPARRRLLNRSSSKIMESIPKIIAALFIIVILAAMWYLYQKKVSDTPNETMNEEESFEYEQNSVPIETPKNDVENEESTEDSQSKETEESETEEPKSEESETGEQTQFLSDGVIEGETTTYQLSGTEQLNIRVEVSGDTWVGIRNSEGEEQIKDRVYTAGEVVEHDSTANAYARIRLGNSKNAKVFINGEELKYAQDLTTQNIIIILEP